MAAEIAEKFQIKSELVEGGGGVFDVVVDGQLVFSKQDQKRFPEHSEVVSAIEALA